MSHERVIVIDRVAPTVPAQHYDLESRRIVNLPLSKALKAAQVVMQRNGRADPHVHARAEQLFIVLAGEMGLRIEGEELRLHPGEAALVHAGETHENYNVFDGITEYIVVSTPVGESAAQA